MTAATVSATGGTALYPPTVAGAAHPLPLRKFLFRFVRNPLSSLPQAIYEEKVIVYDNGRALIVWVCDPQLIEEVLLHGAERFAKTHLERQVFESSVGDGILTSQGASWRWQRRTAAPLFRPADLAGLVPPWSRPRRRSWRAGRQARQEACRRSNVT